MDALSLVKSRRVWGRDWMLDEKEGRRVVACKCRQRSSAQGSAPLVQPVDFVAANNDAEAVRHRDLIRLVPAEPQRYYRAATTVIIITIVCDALPSFIPMQSPTPLGLPYVCGVIQVRIFIIIIIEFLFLHHSYVREASTIESSG